MPSSKHKLTVLTKGYYLFLLLIMIIPTYAFTQESPIDSLKNLLVTPKTDSAKVDILNVLASDLIDVYRPEEAIQYINEAIRLSQRVSYIKGEGIAYINKGNALADNGSLEEAIKMYRLSLDISIQLGDEKWQAECYNNIGIILGGQGQYFESLANHNISLSLRKKIKDTLLIGYSYQNIGIVYTEMGLYPDAVENFINALRVFEKKGVRHSIADTYNNMGVIYWYQQDYQEALKNFKSSLIVLSELNAWLSIGNVKNNIGNVFFDQKKFAEALQYYMESLSIRENINDRIGIATSYLNIGAVYQNQNNHKQALNNFFQSLKLQEELGNQDGISAACINIGISYIKQKRYNDAKFFLMRSLNTSQKNSMTARIRDSHLELSALDSIQGNWKKAYDGYKKYVYYKDILLNEENKREVTKLRTRYEIEKREEAMMLKHEKEIAVSEEKAQSERKIMIIIFISAIIILLAVFYFLKKRKNYRFTKKLSEVKQEAINARMSGHFISNAVDSINNFIESNNKEEASRYLLLFHRLIRKVLNNSFKKFVELESEIEILKMYFELEKLRFNSDSLHFEIEIQDDVDPRQILIPPMVLQTLVENSIKHGLKKSEGGNIKINIKRINHQVEYIVEDNGIGRHASMLLNQMEEQERLSFGSGLAQRLVALSGGMRGDTSYNVVDLYTGDGKPAGTRTEITLPLFPG